MSGPRRARTSPGVPPIVQNATQYYKHLTGRPSMAHRTLAAAAAALLCLCAISQAAGLPRPMGGRARAAAIPDDAIAFVVRRLADGQDVRAFHADVPMP